jgi:hypothetical protein
MNPTQPYHMSPDIKGDLNVDGATTTASLASTGAITAASVAATGAVSAASVDAPAYFVDGVATHPWVSLGETTVSTSVATVDLEWSAAGVFDEVIVYINSIRTANDPQALRLRVYAGDPATVQTSNYRHGSVAQVAATDAHFTSGSSSVGFVDLSVDASNTYAHMYELRGHDLAHDPSFATPAQFTISGSYTDNTSAEFASVRGNMVWDGSNDVVGVRVYAGSGNITSGRIRAYGRNKESA